MAEPAQSARSLAAEVRRDPELAPLRAADFPGCEAVHISPEEIEEYDGRVEYWEARTGTAMVLRETTTHHEEPSQRLAALAALIAAARGSAIETYGTSALVRFDARFKPRVLMQGDQIVYVRPPFAADLGPRVDVDDERLPDVVLEVDHSTDVRVRKLRLYEAWGFPEVWVDVPDERPPSRPKSRLPGLTIHVLEDGRFRTAESSRAFPGWTAEEIHRALNERTRSAATEAALHRVGAVMGAAGGTGPDDDAWLRHYVDTGRAEGRAEGRMKGRAEAHLESVLAVLAERGIAVSSDLPARIAALGTLPVDALMGTALRCSSEADFLELCTGAASSDDARPKR